MQLKERKIKLNELLSGILDIEVKHDCLISNITLDSRAIKNGDLFLACLGSTVDGRDFINEAITKGAEAVLCEDQLPKINLVKDVPIIIVPNLKGKIGLIAAKFYDYPAQKLTMIGVTGTNGKTSITQYIATILTNLGIPCGVIGTIGAGLCGKLNATINTTPDPIALHRLLHELVEDGAKAVAIEVSSQGLYQGRVSGIDFTIGVFTNLTREHLDYHGTMANYGAAKKSFFLQNKLKYAVINIDDEFGYKLALELKSLLNVYTYSISEKSFTEIPAIKAQGIVLKPAAMFAKVVTPWGQEILQSKLLGKFNLSNLLAVIGVLGIMQLSLKDILAKIAQLEAATGRMQVLGGEHQQPLVVIDYAHTPDALEQALLTLGEYCTGSIWCIFGCGGERDRGKRALMGKIAERLSDYVVITNDNPRNEDQKQIVDDIVQGLLCPWAVEVEYDRTIAIEHVINKAAENDIILIAGKGHENYQIIGKEKIPFSDKDIASRALANKMK